MTKNQESLELQKIVPDLGRIPTSPDWCYQVFSSYHLLQMQEQIYRYTKNSHGRNQE